MRCGRKSLRIVLAASAAVTLAMPALAREGASPPTDAQVRTRSDSILAQMTPEEKVGQLSLYFYLAQIPQLNKRADTALDTGLAGGLLFLSDPAQINRLQKLAIEKSRLKIPLLFAFDVEHGLHTIFPVPLGLAASWDPAMMEQVQAASAEEARAVGIHWVFAPMLDIGRDPRWGRVVEGLGEDPFLASAMAAAQVRGFQGPAIGTQGRVVTAIKHFAGYGASTGGRDYDEVELSENELWNSYFPPFKAAIDAGAGTVMAAYMSLNGVPASANRWLLTDVLRKTWGFSGPVVSDSGAISSLKTQGLARDDEAAASMALGAGLDMELVPPMSAPATQKLADALGQNKVEPDQIDDAVRRILGLKIRMGLFENPYVDEKAAARTLGDPRHVALAREAAERSAVLLRNQDNLLPLDRKKVKSIAVIGPLADAGFDLLGPWTFAQNKPPESSILAGLKDKLGKSVAVAYSPGVAMPKRPKPSPFAMVEGGPPAPAPIDETAEIARAVSLAKDNDVTIMVLGESREMIGESASRSTLDLPGRQQELLDAVVATGRPVVVLLVSARPLDLKDTKAPAILDLWYPGSEAGEAAANLLFGDAVPGGKLPFSWIRSAAHAPYDYAHTVSHDPKNANERYWNETNAPTYPFGYGLSYTHFSYANLSVGRGTAKIGESVPVSVEVTNDGARAGDEVAQLYIHQRVGSAARPGIQLKGFQRISLKPHETRRLQFEISAEDLRYWSAAKATWTQDASPIDVFVGSDSTAKLKASFEVVE